MSWLHDRTVELMKRIDETKKHKAYPFFREFENVGSRVKVGDGSFVNFTSNDYLGLSQHPAVVGHGLAGVLNYGTGLGSARPQATSVVHCELERRLAKWLGYEACLNFTTGYQSLVGTMSAFLGDDTTVILDRLSHASIIEGALLARGEHPDLEIRFFRHNRMKALRKCLRTAEFDKKMVVIEGLYSVDGDLGQIADIAQLCKEYNAVLVVDDAHGLGTIGETGRGVGEYFGCRDAIDILIGTFSKSFGGIGGFVCADEQLIEFMKLKARSFMFSASLPVGQVQAAIRALDIIETDYSYMNRLKDNAQWFRDGLVDLGLDLGESCTHITPIYVRDEMGTFKAGAYLYHGAGVIMMPFVSPGVPVGTERLRCNVTAGHTRAEMGYTLEALAKIGPMLDLLPEGAKTRANNLERAMYVARHKIDGFRNAGFGYLASEATKAGQAAVEWGRGLLGR